MKSGNDLTFPKKFPSSFRTRTSIMENGLNRKDDRRPNRRFRKGLVCAVSLLSGGCLSLLIGIQSATAQGFSRAAPRTASPVSTDNPAALRGNPAANPVVDGQAPLPVDVDKVLSPGGLTSTLKVMLLLTVLSLAPSILIMTTCFIRFVIVLGLLRQALGTQQLPPNQVIVSLCLFLTFMVMSPVWQEAYESGIKPYSDGRQPSLQVAFEETARPMRRFMSDQIESGGNSDSVWMFLDFQQSDDEDQPSAIFRDPDNPTYDELPLTVLLPAFMLSELKTAFVIGFQVYLPFLVIDMVVSSVLISMGMMMLPPVLISLPFKLLLFVMVDGWALTVGMLLQTVRPFG